MCIRDQNEGQVQSWVFCLIHEHRAKGTKEFKVAFNFTPYNTVFQHFNVFVTPHRLSLTAL